MPENLPTRRGLRVPRSPATIAAGAVASVAVFAAIATVGPEAAAQSEGRVVTAESGVIQKTVSGTGNLAAAHEVDLGFATSGTVEKVFVKLGQHVEAGRLIGRLDDERQQVAVAQAKAALTSARTALTDAEDADDTTASAADATTSTAASGSGATSGIATSGSTATTGSGSSGTTSSGSSSGTSPSGSTSGGSSGTSGSTMSVASAEASVTSAKLDLEDAEEALEETRLRAPVAGTITSLHGAVGQTVSGSGSSTVSSSAAGTSSTSTTGATAGAATGSTGSDSGSTSSGSTSFATLSQLSRLDLEVSFSESDIGDLKVGQAASVTVTALDGVELAAKVTDIGTTSTSSSGVVSYPVTLAVTQKADGVLPGMSASAEVVTSQAKGISVPSQAVSGRSVTVRKGGKDTPTAVATGVVGDSTTQVLSGLRAGDEVVLPALSTTSSTSSGSGSGSASGTLGGTGGGTGGGFGGGAPGGGTGGPPGGGR